MKDLEKQIEEKKQEIDNFKLDCSKYEIQYDDMLDECYEGIFGLLPSRILSECDPIQYRCGMSDYLDSLDVEDDEDYQALTGELDDLEIELEEQ